MFTTVTTLQNRTYQTEIRTFAAAIRRGYGFLAARALAKYAKRTRKESETTDQVIDRVVVSKDRTLQSLAVH